jgi:hypothetical protein
LNLKGLWLASWPLPWAAIGLRQRSSIKLCTKETSRTKPWGGAAVVYAVSSWQTSNWKGGGSLTSAPASSCHFASSLTPYARKPQHKVAEAVPTVGLNKTSSIKSCTWLPPPQKGWRHSGCCILTCFMEPCRQRRGVPGRSLRKASYTNRTYSSSSGDGGGGGSSEVKNHPDARCALASAIWHCLTKC